jgi:4-amino-4-deoxy-L-arabinose transferase-like glycosyltransferase
MRLIPRWFERSWTRWPFWCAVTGLILGYLVITGMLSARRPLWYDELITYYVASRPTLRDVWAVLLTGAEQSPPLFYLITRAALSVFGVSAQSLRLVEMFGIGVTALSIYFFARRGVSRISASAGAVFLLCTAVYPYAYEARSKSSRRFTKSSF